MAKTIDARTYEEALTWLRDDLARWSKKMASDKAEMRAAARRALAHWLRDPDLIGLREEAALARLPTVEREACRSLWEEVRKLLEP